MLHATYVNTPIDHNVFHYLRAHVARCSVSCVNGAQPFIHLPKLDASNVTARVANATVFV